MRAFSKDGAGASGHPPVKIGQNLDLNLIPYVKFNLKLITGLNIKYKTTKPLGKKVGENIQNLE